MILIANATSCSIVSDSIRTVRHLFNVSRGSFMPSPNVDSAVIRIDIDKKYNLNTEQEKFFFKIVKSGFSQRRKTLANALSSLMGIEKEKTYYVLKSIDASESVRIESLTMEQLVALAISIHTYITYKLNNKCISGKS